MESKESSGRPKFMLVKEWLAGGIANAVTSAILNPMDIAKTRIQMYTTSNFSITLLVREISALFKSGGIIGVWKPGITASMIREMLSSGPRAGFYVPVREKVNILFGDGADKNLLPKIVAAMSTGIIGSMLANPIDVIKIRLMTNTINNNQQYSNVRLAFPIILKQEGIQGFYKGLVPSTLRGAFIAGNIVF